MFQEYELDGIDWSKVDFEDNQECLNLFEKVFFLLVLFPIYMALGAYISRQLSSAPDSMFTFVLN